MVLLQELLFSSFIVQVDASYTFSRNCTLSTETSHFVVSPNVRSTVDILWSSLFVLFICTWTVQHLNLPPSAQTKDRTRWENVMIELDEFIRKGKWMVVTVLAPEWTLGTALVDRALAKQSQQAMGSEEWTITHAFYANMGGFVLQFNVEKTCLAVGTDERVWRLNANQLQYLYQQSFISRLSTISENEIRDKSKSDAFVKGTAIMQVSWLLIQVLARHLQQGLSTSQLEIGVLAFAVCTLITYVLVWDKPQDVNVPTYIDAVKPLSQLQVEKLGCISSNLSGPSATFNHIPVIPAISNVSTWPVHMSTDEPIELKFVTLGIALGGMIFGAIHCFAWNFQFPTVMECWLWRSAAILSIVLPLIWAFSDTLLLWTEDILGLLTFMVVPAYIMARLFLIVEMFRSLAFLPSSAFRTVQWAQFLPHVS